MSLEQKIRDFVIAKHAASDAREKMVLLWDELCQQVFESEESVLVSVLYKGNIYDITLSHLQDSPCYIEDCLVMRRASIIDMDKTE